MRPPRVSVITFTSYICCIYALKFGQYWTLFCVGNSSVSKRLVYSFCSSDRGFASDFLQTPPHGGRPCLWLTVPTAKPVADFHRQVITHAERTTKKLPFKMRAIFLLQIKNFTASFKNAVHISNSCAIIGKRYILRKCCIHSVFYFIFSYHTSSAVNYELIGR